MSINIDYLNNIHIIIDLDTFYNIQTT